MPCFEVLIEFDCNHSLTIFDTKLRIEISRNELTSSGLSVGFLSHGRTIGYCRASGKTPLWKVEFIICRVSPGSDIRRFSNDVE